MNKTKRDYKTTHQTQILPKVRLWIQRYYKTTPRNVKETGETHTD
jgi:hypothetical protein